MNKEEAGRIVEQVWQSNRGGTVSQRMTEALLGAYRLGFMEAVVEAGRAAGADDHGDDEARAARGE